MGAFARGIAEGIAEVGNAAFGAAGACLDVLARRYVPVMFTAMAIVFVYVVVMTAVS